MTKKAAASTKTGVKARPDMRPVPLTDLNLDLHNYRTVEQPDEAHALEAMISVRPERFWALMNSLIEHGYFPTESVLVLEEDGKFVVREGNRRVAALKLAHNLLKRTGGPIPDHTQKLLAAVDAEWVADTSSVPCTIYQSSEEATVDHIVALTHGLAQQAGRDGWTSVAKARHLRDEEGIASPALDLLEKYLKVGRNLSEEQKQRWAGEYNLTVLDATISKIPDAFGYSDAKSLIAAYPMMAKRDVLESVMFDIGQKRFGYDAVRANLAATVKKYSLLTPKSLAGTGGATPTAGGGASPAPAPSPTKPASTSTPAAAAGPIALPVTDPKSVTNYLKGLTLVGTGREKAETIKAEMIALNIKKTPLAFGLLLRSFIELMAKTYVTARPGSGITLKDGLADRDLMKVLNDIVAQVAPDPAPMPGTTKAEKAIKAAAKQKHKEWRDVLNTLAEPTNVLSVMSMNGLVHHPTYTVRYDLFCREFHNIKSLIEELNSLPPAPTPAP